MADVKVKVSSGICGMETIIKASCDDMQTVLIRTETDCVQVMRLALAVAQVDAMEELFSGFGKGRIMEAAEVNIRHAACPVPAAFLKAVEVAAGMALKKDVHIIFD
ncbi:MAG TPA: hypothetical protein DDZ89_06010 [Clostridiales bacterium]|nr:hypothetical protein [Clostridiales bacterium]